jgi:hypothetical protein
VRSAWIDQGGGGSSQADLVVYYSIAHHKSYHPYKSENIERVRRDEERAEAQESGDRAKVMQADSEARIALLRKRAKKGKSKEEDQAEKALERQLHNKGRPEAAEEQEPAELVARKPEQTNVTITTADGHCEEADNKQMHPQTDYIFC